MAKNKHPKRELLMVGDNASFQFNEAYKSLRTNLEFLAATSDCKSILVTSSVPTEGKSNVAVNLACTMAAAGKKVILMDCDLRKGTLGHYLHLRRGAPGLTGKLSGAAEWNDICYSIPHIDNLTVIPTGPLPPNPSELLASRQMGALFEELKAHCDALIVDTPPVSLVTDAAVLSRYTDGVILVVRPEVTTIQGAHLSKKNLEAVDAHILGVVINGYDTKKSTKKDGYYYSYNYYGYYDEDGSSGKSKSKGKSK